MRIISRSRLREFWEGRKADAKTAERDLTAWYKLARGAEWADFGALKQTFGTADRVGNCTVFDVGNNRYRLIGRVFFGGASGRIYVLAVMDHAEYDKGAWVSDCRCHEPPPRKAPPRRQGRK